MRKTWGQIKNETMSKEAQRRAHVLAMHDLAEMEMSELREALHVRQAELADKMKMTQAAVSRLERRPNVMLESISNYVEALGGKLELRAVLPDRTIKLTNLFVTSGERGKSPVRRRRVQQVRQMIARERKRKGSRTKPGRHAEAAAVRA